MENQLQVFNNAEFGQVRTIVEGDKILFCASDVAKALGYRNYNDAVNKHCRAIVKCDTPISGKIQAINFIPEGDIYRLIIRSKLPTAEKFESWVFDEVLPSIRKTGSYSTKQQPVDDTKKLRSEAMLLNARTRQAKMWKELSQMTTIKEYKEIAFAKAGNVLAGKDLFNLPEATQKTYSADEIGAILGVSANKIGRLANTYNLKTPQFGKWFYDKAQYSNKEVETFRYYENAISKFRTLLGGAVA
ncbi:MAG: Bro-N domain-containing protein [Megamonas funiformis]|uniref:BRO-N domain-containing protein n=1 Tax=Megamonas funiformis TaxID=437897 RepID=UPI003990C20A